MASATIAAGKCNQPRGAITFLADSTNTNRSPQPACSPYFYFARVAPVALHISFIIDTTPTESPALRNASPPGTLPQDGRKKARSRRDGDGSACPGAHYAAKTTEHVAIRQLGTIHLPVQRSSQNRRGFRYRGTRLRPERSPTIPHTYRALDSDVCIGVRDGMPHATALGNASRARSRPPQARFVAQRPHVRSHSPTGPFRH